MVGRAKGKQASNKSNKLRRAEEVTLLVYHNPHDKQ